MSKKHAALLILAGALSCQAADVRDALQAFDGLCIDIGERLPVLEKMAAGAKAPPVPSEVLVMDPAIAVYGGKGYIFTQGEFRFAVAMTQVGSAEQRAKMMAGGLSVVDSVVFINLATLTVPLNSTT